MAQEDTTPAQLVAFSFSPNSIDVSGGAQTVTVTLRITDNLSGFGGGGFSFVSPSGQQTRGYNFGVGERISGDALDGVYQLALQFPQFSEAGTWRVQGLILFDLVGNRNDISTAQFVALGFPTDLQVVGGPDLAPAQLVAFSFSPVSIDVSSAPQTVTVSLRITDNLSGFSGGGFSFVSPSGKQSRGYNFGFGERTSGDALDSTYELALQFPQYSEAGAWRVQGLVLFDQVGNRIDLSLADFASKGFPTHLDVISVPDDTIPSQLAEFSFNPTSINISGGAQTVHVTLRITDNLSGFGGGGFSFVSPSGQQTRGYNFGFGERTSGGALDSTYELLLQFPQFSEAGAWRVQGLVLFDRVGNRIDLTGSDFGTMGFPTILQVVENQPPVANAGADRTVPCTNLAGTRVVLDGSGSSDPDHDVLTYKWTGPFLEGGGTIAGASPTVTLPIGTHTLTLTVDDGKGGTATDSVQFGVALGVEGLASPMASLTPEGAPTILPDKAFKQGRAIPPKLRLYCGGTPLTDTEVAAPQIVRLLRNSDALNLATLDLDAGQSSDSGTNFRFADGSWSYNLNTKLLLTGTYVLTIQMPDGRRYNAAFVLR